LLAILFSSEIMLSVRKYTRKLVPIVARVFFCHNFYSVYRMEVFLMVKNQYRIIGYYPAFLFGFIHF
jgi:hypothetical protein